MMEVQEILLSLVSIAGFTYVLASVVNYSQRSAEKAKRIKQEAMRRLHAAAISGDQDAAVEWNVLSKEVEP